METPNIRIGAQNTTGFSKVFVSGEKMTFSGGPNNRTQAQTISIHRTPEGIIYLDEKGSVLTKWDPQNGVIEVKNVLGNFEQVTSLAIEIAIVKSIFSFPLHHPP